jgi:hypothetical protein
MTRHVICKNVSGTLISSPVNTVQQLWWIMTVDMCCTYMTRVWWHWVPAVEIVRWEDYHAIKNSILPSLVLRRLITKRPNAGGICTNIAVYILKLIVILSLIKLQASKREQCTVLHTIICQVLILAQPFRIKKTHANLRVTNAEVSVAMTWLSIMIVLEAKKQV